MVLPHPVSPDMIITRLESKASIICYFFLAMGRYSEALTDYKIELLRSELVTLIP